MTTPETELKTEISGMEEKAADTEARVRTAVSSAVASIRQEIEHAGPSVRDAVEHHAAKLLADLEEAFTS